MFVEVTDVNDNRPMFLAPPGGYTANISENAFIGDVIIIVEATDLDQQIDGVQDISYSILTNSTSVELPFVIHPEVSCCAHKNFHFSLSLWLYTSLVTSH